MKKTVLFFVIPFAAVMGSSCNEDSHTAPEVTITSPVPGQEVMPGDTLVITASVIHTEELHEYDVRVIRVSDRAELYSFGDHTHEMQLDISRQWVNNLPETEDLRVIVRANDHAGHTGADSVDFHAHH